MIFSKRLLPSLDVEEMGGAAVNDDEDLAVLEKKVSGDHHEKNSNCL